MFKKSPATIPAPAPTVEVPAALKPSAYRSNSGHEIVPTDKRPIEVFTESEMDNIDPGKVVRAIDGTCYTVTEVRHIQGRLYKVVLLPVNI